MGSPRAYNNINHGRWVRSIWVRRALTFVGASVILFAVGRVAFLRGYPGGAGTRAFGMALTALPSVVAFVVAAGSVIARVLR